MKGWSLARGYPELLVNNEMEKVVFGTDQSVQKISESDFCNYIST